MSLLYYNYSKCTANVNPCGGESEIKPIQFTPKSIPTMSKYPKYAYEKCNGIEINITNRDNYKSILSGITLIWAINKLLPDELMINQESMGRLWGSDQLVKQLNKGKTPHLNS